MTPKRHDELRAARDETQDPLARRDFMKLMGAALALAGVDGCTRAPTQEIVPYVVQPPETKAGRPRFYASATILDGYATGVLVESHEGRPTKIEGNPDHPSSLGASGVFDQASVLGLYDPRRARATKARGEVTDWETVSAAITHGPWTERRGRGLHLVLEPTSSPAMEALLGALRARFPEVGVHFHAAAPRTNVWAGARAAFGRVLEPRYDLANADVIVALEVDFLGGGPAHLRLARQFADGRRLSTRPSMNRLYAVEALTTITGASADHRLRVRARDVAALTAALLGEVKTPGGAPLPPADARFLRALARDLAAHRGRSLVIAGDAQPAHVHVLAHALNAELGNVGATVSYAPSPILEAGAPSHELAPLADALEKGEVDTLLVLGANAAYASPGDRPLGVRFARARQSVYLGRYEDETAAACTFTIAEAHPLESWGDARAFDGTISIVQPLIEPLFGGRTALDVLALYTRPAPVTSYALVREHSGDDASFRRALTRGVIDGTAIPTVAATVSPAAINSALGAIAAPHDDLEILFPLDLRVHDGRFADNAWLLELPSSITKLTWENAATIAPETAAPLGIVTGDELELRWQGRSVRASAMVVPGQAAGTVGLSLGWGRTASDSLSRGRGVNAYALRSEREPFFGGGLTIAKTGLTRDLAFTQTHQSLEGRDHDILHHSTLDDGVIKGRAMHWLRIDTYFSGDIRAPEVLTQPMLCQHCEKAPCEYVCPTNATVHGEDGLNQMVYNRCVGTRFCSNNCPYKVRRFNWFDFHHDESETEQLVHNPDVTVRERGVMEKCTFCVQRIRENDIQGAIGRRPNDPPRAPLQTACQQACASRAINFGDVQDPNSETSKLHRDERAFAALDDLGTVPGVRYLARVTNPNPELA